MVSSTGSEEPGTCHLPVMVEEVKHYLLTDRTRLIVDCTVGTGGHARELLKACHRQCALIGLDLDEQALEIASERLSAYGERVSLRKMNFRDLQAALPVGSVGKVDAVLIDCGISRLQIVQGHRGFSFDREGELDMRFDTSEPFTAPSLLDRLTAAGLRRRLVEFGLGSAAGGIAGSIIRWRDRGRLRSTLDLAEAVRPFARTRTAKVIAKVFLALRSAVNREGENLNDALESLPEVLAHGGRACVIAYHSTEDRIVKTSFRKYSGRCVCAPGRPFCDCGRERVYRVLTPKPIAPTAEEVKHNPSARSARLRAVEKM